MWFLPPLIFLCISLGYWILLEWMSKKDATAFNRRMDALEKCRDIEMQAKIYEAKCKNMPKEEREVALRKLAAHYGFPPRMDEDRRI